MSASQDIFKVSPDWICMVTSRFTKLFYCERTNIAHIQSGDTLGLIRALVDRGIVYLT